MHKYIINLKRRKDRLKKFKKTSPFKFEEIQVFKGFDGLHPNNNEYGLDEYKIISEHSQMKEGEKGCFISHLNIWRDMVKNDIEYAYVIEDDAIFCKLLAIVAVSALPPEAACTCCPATSFIMAPDWLADGLV